MTGIYKITSPNGRIYIGQAVDVERRKGVYRAPEKRFSSRIFNSIHKHGFHAHIFEVVEECRVEDLNERERYWQDFYEVTGPKGLNCRLTTTEDKSGYAPKESYGLETCPHCGTVMPHNVIRKWHFDNCEKVTGFQRKIPKSPDRRITCPHCGKEGPAGAMTRHHMDNCPVFTGKPRPKLVKRNPRPMLCPHCGRTVKNSRYHFDNCKLNPEKVASLN